MATMRVNQISADDLNEDISITANTGQTVNVSPSLTNSVANLSTVNVFGQPILKKASNNSSLTTLGNWYRVATIPSNGSGRLRIYATDGAGNTTNLVIDITNNSTFDDPSITNTLGFKPRDMTWTGTKPLIFLRVLGHNASGTNPLLINVRLNTAGITTPLTINVVGEIYPDTVNDFTVGGFNDDTAGVVDYNTIRTIKVLPVGGISIFRNTASRAVGAGTNYYRYDTLVQNDLEITPLSTNEQFPCEEDCIWVITFDVFANLGGGTNTDYQSWLEFTAGTAFRYGAEIQPFYNGDVKNSGDAKLVMAPTPANNSTVRVGNSAGVAHTLGSGAISQQAVISITREYL